MASTRFHILLKERVEEEINKHRTDLARGMAKDYADYKFSAGYIAGLNDSLKLCEDIEGEFDERSDSASRG